MDDTTYEEMYTNAMLQNQDDFEIPDYSQGYTRDQLLQGAGGSHRTFWRPENSNGNYMPVPEGFLKWLQYNAQRGVNYYGDPYGQRQGGAPVETASYQPRESPWNPVNPNQPAGIDGGGWVEDDEEPIPQPGFTGQFEPGVTQNPGFGMSNGVPPFGWRNPDEDEFGGITALRHPFDAVRRLLASAGRVPAKFRESMYGNPWKNKRNQGSDAFERGY